MNFQSCLCVTPWVWICFFWIEGTLYEIATQICCQDKILELFWQHWKWEITQISMRQEDNLQCNLSVKVYQIDLNDGCCQTPIICLWTIAQNEVLPLTNIATSQITPALATSQPQCEFPETIPTSPIIVCEADLYILMLYVS